MAQVGSLRLEGDDYASGTSGMLAAGVGTSGLLAPEWGKLLVKCLLALALASQQSLLQRTLCVAKQLIFVSRNVPTRQYASVQLRAVGDVAGKKVAQARRLRLNGVLVVGGVIWLCWQFVEKGYPVQAAWVAGSVMVALAAVFVTRKSAKSNTNGK